MCNNQYYVQYIDHRNGCMSDAKDINKILLTCQYFNIMLEAQCTPSQKTLAFNTARNLTSKLTYTSLHLAQLTDMSITVWS